MKNTILLCVAVATSIFSLSAKTIPLIVGKNVGTTLSAATTISGDTIELTQEGVYLWNAQASIGNGGTSVDAKSITIRAAKGLATRPIVQCQATSATILTLALYKTNGSIIVLDGIDFDGANKVSFLWTVKSYNTTAAPIAPPFNISIRNCVIRNFGPTTSSAGLASLVSYSASAPVLAPGFLSVSNTVFENLTSSAFYTNAGGKPDSLNFTNCYFKGSYLKGAIANLNTSGPTGAQIRKIVIDHCAFNGGTAADVSVYNIKGDTTSTTSISNSIFANNTGTTANSFGFRGNLKNHCGVFFAGTANTVYADSLIDASTVMLDPAFDSNGFATALQYVGAASDGKAIGFWAAASLTNGIKTVKVDCGTLTAYQRGPMLLVNGATGNANYAIYNVNGSHVQSGTIAAGSLTLKSDAKGIYLLRTNKQSVRFVVR